MFTGSKQLRWLGKSARNLNKIRVRQSVLVLSSFRVIARLIILFQGWVFQQRSMADKISFGMTVVELIKNTPVRRLFESISDQTVSLHLALHDELRDTWILDAGHKMEGSGKHMPLE